MAGTVPLLSLHFLEGCTSIWFPTNRTMALTMSPAAKWFWQTLHSSVSFLSVRPMALSHSFLISSFFGGLKNPLPLVCFTLQDGTKQLLSLLAVLSVKKNQYNYVLYNLRWTGDVWNCQSVVQKVNKRAKLVSAGRHWHHSANCVRSHLLTSTLIYLG